MDVYACSNCNGSGRVKFNPANQGYCPICKGSGRHFFDIKEYMSKKVRCPRCNGTGYAPGTNYGVKCSACMGSGKVPG